MKGSFKVTLLVEKMQYFIPLSMKTLTFSLSFLFVVLSSVSFSQWSMDPALNTVIANASGEEVIPKVVYHPSGIYYIAWFSIESSNYNVRLQKLDFYGNKLWQDEGLLVSSHTSMSWLTDWSIAVDHDTCAILVFQDIRTGNNDVFAYRISPSGQFLWGPDGVALSNNADFEATPQVTVTDQNNCVFAWSREGTTQYIMLQKVSPEGLLQWGDGLAISGSEDYTWPVLVPGDNDQVMMAFFKQTGPFWAPTKNLFIQRFDASGQELWGTGEPITTQAGIPAYHIATMIPDGNDGAFLCWFDDRDANVLFSVFAQHVNSSGVTLFADGGVETSNIPEHHLDPSMALQPTTGDLYVIWCERDPAQNDRGISGQRISPSGVNLWTDAGKVLIPIGPGDYTSIKVGAIEEDVVFLYFKSAYGTMNSTVNAMRIDPEGNFTWTPAEKPVSTVQGEKMHMDALGFDNEQFVTVWEDLRTGTADIYAQNLLADGSIGPQTYALMVTPDTLWFQDLIQFIDGLEFQVINNTPSTLQIDNMEMTGDFSGAWLWWIEPEITTFPVIVEPQSSLTFTVYLPVPVSDQGVMIYDTVNIWSGNDEFRVIIKVDSDLLSEIRDLNDDPGFAAMVSPNPFSDELSVVIDNTGKSDYVDIAIIRPDGKIMISEIIKNTADRNRINYQPDKSQLEKMAPGVYYLKVRNENSVLTRKIIHVK